MKYPCFRISGGRTALANRKDESGSPFALVPAEYRSVDSDLDDDEAQDALKEMGRIISPGKANSLKSEGLSRDQVEGLLALELHRHLVDFPPEALGDPDFWRYVSVDTVRDFVFWRDGVDCSYASFGLSSARRIPDCVPLRMFNRAHIAKAIGNRIQMKDTEVVIVGGADFWQSHVLRVQNRFDPQVVAELVHAQATGTIPNVQVLREAAKDIRRRRANLVLELQSREDVEALMSNIIQSVTPAT